MALPDQIGRYRIVRQLGQGGMGVVYEARDEELNRALAIKIIAEPNAEAVMRERFRREARAAAGIRHPNVCQVYEIGEHEKTLFIAMELLEGESLAARIQRGPLPVPDALTVALETLSALDALHSRDLVHRDLKPSNIFLGPHGIKLLDFGLAKPPSSSPVRAEDETISPLTQEGLVVGTPQYMASEQVLGRSVDGRSDLFSLGAILFEMLTGSRPFKGSSPMELYHAVLYEEPPVIGGFPAASAIDQVVRRALAKRPDDRYRDAAAMAHELEAARARDDSGEALAPRAITRLMILPFRVLRSDPDTDFLAFSIPDAVGNALAGLQSLVVRSTAAGARFAGDVLDLNRIAREAEVDVVLTGSLVRAGNRIQVTTQLIETPSGTLLWSHAPQVSLQDLFQLQNEVVQGIVDSLSLSLTARERRLLKHDVPASAKAYEFYLRANQAGQAAIALDPGSWAVARDLYLSMPGGGPALRAGLGPDRTDIPGHGEVGTRRIRNESGEGRSGIQASARHQSGPVHCAQSVRTARGRSRPGRRRHAPADRARESRGGGPRAVCRPRVCVPLLRVARSLGGRSPSGSAAGSRCRNERRTNLLHAR